MPGMYDDVDEAPPFQPRQRRRRRLGQEGDPMEDGGKPQLSNVDPDMNVRPRLSNRPQEPAPDKGPIGRPRGKVGPPFGTEEDAQMSESSPDRNRRNSYGGLLEGTEGQTGGVKPIKRPPEPGDTPATGQAAELAASIRRRGPDVESLMRRRRTQTQERFRRYGPTPTGADEEAPKPMIKARRRSFNPYPGGGYR